MISAIGLTSPQQTILLIALAIALPVILIALGLAFMKGAHNIKSHPRAFLIISFIMGACYIALLVGSYYDQKRPIILIVYGVTAVLWPVVGVVQYRAMKKANETNKQNPLP